MTEIDSPALQVALAYYRRGPPRLERAMTYIAEDIVRGARGAHRRDEAYRSFMAPFVQMLIRSN